MIDQIMNVITVLVKSVATVWEWFKKLKEFFK